MRTRFDTVHEAEIMNYLGDDKLIKIRFNKKYEEEIVKALEEASFTIKKPEH